MFSLDSRQSNGGMTIRGKKITQRPSRLPSPRLVFFVVSEAYTTPVHRVFRCPEDLSMKIRNWLCLAWFLSFSVFAEPAPAPEPAEVSPPPTSETLPFVDNEALLDHFQRRNQELEYGFRANLRAVREQELLLEEHRQSYPAEAENETDGSEEIEEASAGGENSENHEDSEAPPEAEAEDEQEQASQRELAAAKARWEQLQQSVARQEREKVLLEQYLARISTAQAELTGARQQFKELAPHARQIELRLTDGTLTLDAVPEALRSPARQGLIEAIEQQQQALEHAALGARQQLGQHLTRLEETQTAETDAKADFETAREHHEYMRQRHELEQQYAAKSVAALIRELTGLGEELAWLRGSFEKAREPFAQADKAHRELVTQIEALTPPDTSQLQDANAADMPQAKSLFKELNDYHRKHLALLDGEKSILAAVTEQGKTLLSEATVLHNHLYKMEIVAGVLNKRVRAGEADLEQIPEAVRQATLGALSKTLNEVLADTEGAIQNADKRLAKLDQARKRALHDIARAEQRLKNIEKVQQAEQETLAWEEEIKSFDGAKVVTVYNEITEQWSVKEQELEQAQKAFAEAETAMNEDLQKLEALQGPMMRKANEAAPEGRKEITASLYRFAGLEMPKSEEAPAPEVDVEAPPPPSESATSEREDTNARPEAEKPAQPSPVEALGGLIEAYQSQLGGFLRINEEYGDQEGQFKTTLQTARDAGQAYQIQLDALHALARQHHAIAIELKKRVGRGELTAKNIPANIHQALQSDALEQLATAREDLFQRQQIIEEFAHRLEIETHEAQQTLPEKITQLHEMTGKRLDAFRQAKKLDRQFFVEREKRTKIEQKTLEQAARRRISLDNEPHEFLLLFFHSDQVDHLTDILQEYYLQLSELESKLENLRQQKAQHENALTELGEEKVLLPELLPLFQQMEDFWQQQYDEQLALLKARLAPEKAEEILAAHNASSGNDFSPPVPIAEDQRGQVIERESRLLHGLQTVTRAMALWHQLFTQRLETIAEDMSVYQETVAKLEAEETVLQRRVAAISGHPPEAMAKLSEKEKPVTPLEITRFLKGEIGVIRMDRMELYQDLLLLLGVKLLVLLILVLVVILIINISMNRVIKRTQQKLDSGESTDQSALAVRVMLRKFFKLGVWSLAFIMALEIFGFNVGAILAGLGIGGLAIAMAAKNVLADLLGGITVMMLGLYKIGDMISFKGEAHIVKEIGLRYTILEDFSYNHKVTAPNSLLSETEVISISAHPGYTVLTNIGLSMDNSAEKITLAVKLIQKVIESNPRARFIWVKHDHFDNHAFVLRMHYDILQFKERSVVETQINAGVAKAFQANHIRLVAVSRMAMEEKLEAN